MRYVSPIFDALKGRPVYDERDAETLNTGAGKMSCCDIRHNLVRHLKHL